MDFQEQDRKQASRSEVRVSLDEAKKSHRNVLRISVFLSIVK